MLSLDYSQRDSNEQLKRASNTESIMMVFIKILLSGLSLIFIGGFAYFSIMEVPVHQKDVVETLPASHFQK